ncbi:unnamed protein product [Auanema sp. JU1783]|nr:unnamed protein product [Auanema sp. JU1783]
MFMDREALIHFVGGAVGGTAGTALTCPLEVIKTRMQSSKGFNITGGGPSTSQGDGPKQNPPGFNRQKHGHAASQYKQFLGSDLRGQLAIHNIRVQADVVNNPMSLNLARFVQSQSQSSTDQTKRRFQIFRYFAHVVRTEGVSALYKGLVPNLVGVAPSKAVYFYSYSTSKRFWNESELFIPDRAIVHMVSAGTAGFVAASVVNPIWLVKTRLQLHHGSIGIFDMIKRVYKREGIRGFYKGVTASYAGVSETVIQFVIYEHLRSLLLNTANHGNDARKMDFLNFMVAGGAAKFIACVIAYPHEVVRTRLREESEVKRGFFRTLLNLYHEGGRAMYRGLSVQLLRTVPNTAITMGTYELVVYLLHRL